MKTSEFRKLIREEIQAALREELPKLLSEGRVPLVSRSKQLEEQVKSRIPGTLNSAPQKPINFNSGPMAAFLNDTAKNMLYEDFSMTSENVHPSMAFQPKEDRIGTVDSMLASARPSSNLDAVQINEVPDFTRLMSKLKETGQI
jgi:hypothetical protein